MPRALLVKLGAIGDVIMTVPAAYAVHQAGGEIDWVCGQSVAPLLELYPWINVIAADDAALLRGGKVIRAKNILGLWRKLLGRHYDLVATLYYDSRYKLLTLPVRATRKVFLSHTDRAMRLIPGRHHTSEYSRILLGWPDGETPHAVAPLPPASIPATAFLRQPKSKRIVLAPAGAHNALREDALRRWPVESYVELAKAFLARGYEVLLVGGPTDTWASQFFADLRVTDLMGKLSLVESLSLLDSADLVVTHDTGPLHLAGISRAAVVAIFGPTSPHTFLPRRNDVVALWGGEGFACRPCYDGRNYPACTNNGCVQQITPAMVFTEAETLLTARAECRTLLPRVRVPKHTPPVLPVTALKS